MMSKASNKNNIDYSPAVDDTLFDRKVSAALSGSTSKVDGPDPLSSSSDDNNEPESIQEGPAAALLGSIGISSKSMELLSPILLNIWGESFVVTSPVSE